MLNQFLLRKGPEPFHPVDVHLSPFELVSMVDVEVTVSTEHEGIVAPPLVGVYDGSPTDLLHRLLHQGLCRSIGNDAHRYLPLTFQDPEDDGLVPGSSSSPPFPLSPEVCLICLDLALEELILPGEMSNDGSPDGIEGSQGSGIAYTGL